MSSTIYSTYTAGRSVLEGLSFMCYNNGYTYPATSHKGGENGQVDKVSDSNKRPAGFTITEDFNEGSLDFTYALTTDAAANSFKRLKQGWLIQYGPEYFAIMKADLTESKGAATAGSISILRHVGPCFPTLQSPEGNIMRYPRKIADGTVTVDDAAIHAGSAWNLTAAAVNTRTGATVTYTLEGAPSGMTINASTGAITWATPVVGSYTFKVVVTDSMGATSKEPDMAQAGNIGLTVTA